MSDSTLSGGSSDIYLIAGECYRGPRSCGPLERENRVKPPGVPLELPEGPWPH